MLSSQKNKLTLFVVIFLLTLVCSAYKPEDYFTWFLEVFPALIVFFILLFSYKKFPLSDLLYSAILIHSIILFVGGHYTYAKVPLFDWIRDSVGESRNNYDKLGHFAQGFVPAIAARELLVRKNVLNNKNWLSFIVIAMCLAVSACYKLLEALVAMLTGESAEAFLGTQGYVWDTQTDMFLAMIGAISAVVLLSGVHDRFIKKLSQPVAKVVSIV